MRCCICNRRLGTGGWVCQKCKALWGLSVPHSEWPAWARALLNAEQKERRTSLQWRGRIVNYGDDSELDSLLVNKEAGQLDLQTTRLCVDCAKPIHPTAMRCRSCAGRERHRDGVLGGKETLAAIGKKVSEAHARGAYDGAYQQISGPERAIAAKLDELGITYQQQYHIGDDSRRFDFYIPASHVLIEYDGSYWHSIPGAPERDRAKEAFAVANGYRVLRIAEEDYNRYGIGIVATLLECA